MNLVLLRDSKTEAFKDSLEVTSNIIYINNTNTYLNEIIDHNFRFFIEEHLNLSNHAWLLIFIYHQIR